MKRYLEIIRKRLKRIQFIRNIYYEMLDINNEIAFFLFQINNFITYGNNEVFRNICIETSSLCNRKCNYCPVAYYPRQKIDMPEIVFFRIINQLAEKKYRGMIGLHWYNEPLLDKRLFKFIEYARSRCPKSHIYFATNGDFLDINTFKALIKAGINHITISLHKEDFSDDLHKFLDSLDKKDKKYIHINPLGYICNRAGALRELEILKPIKLKCRKPDLQMVVTAEGKVVLCCNDYFGKEVIGDATCENVFDIWSKSRFREIRKELRRGDRNNIDICSKCDIVYL